MTQVFYGMQDTLRAIETMKRGRPHTRFSVKDLPLHSIHASFIKVRNLPALQCSTCPNKFIQTRGTDQTQCLWCMHHPDEIRPSFPKVRPFSEIDPSIPQCPIDICEGCGYGYIKTIDENQVKCLECLGAVDLTQFSEGVFDYLEDAVNFEEKTE